MKTHTLKQLFKYSLALTISLILFVSCEKTPSEIINNYLTPPVADAGNPRTIILPVSFDTLRGKDTAFNGRIKGRLWSLISGPNIPTIERPSSATTRIGSMIAGIYKFQYAVTDSAGLTGVDTTSITVLPDTRPVQTLVLQPSNNADEATLSWTNSGNATGVNFNLTELVAAAWTNGGELYLIRSVLKFDLSSIPSNAVILTAGLSLYSNPTPINGNQVNANYGPVNAMYIERNTTPWNATLTWGTQPSGDAASQIIIPHTNLSSFDLIDINVKDMVANMVSTNNYGFNFRLQNEAFYNLRNFCSSKHPVAAKRPKLIVTYK